MRIAVMVAGACSLLVSAAAAAPPVVGGARVAPAATVGPKFRVLSVAQLKAEEFGVAPIKVRGATMPLVRAPAMRLHLVNAGNAAYRTGNGIALDVMHPSRSNPQALILVQNVEWDQNTWAGIASDNPDPVLRQLRPPGVSQPSFLVTALFRDLPSEAHTYLLTLGTTAGAAGLKMQLLRGAYVDPEYTPGVTNTMQEFGPDKLIANPGANEVRALFTYAAGVEPLSVRWYWGPTGGTRANFHHLQLVQLD